MSWLPGGDRHASGGERIDDLSHSAVGLAFRVLDRFPSLVKRHKYIAGGAAISGSLIALASVAVARRMRRGESAEEAVNAVTEDELSGLHLVSDRQAKRSGDADATDDSNGDIVPEPPDVAPTTPAVDATNEAPDEPPRVQTAE